MKKQCRICGTETKLYDTRCWDCDQRYRRLLLQGIHSVANKPCPACGRMTYTHEPHTCVFCEQCGVGRQHVGVLCYACKSSKITASAKVKQKAKTNLLCVTCKTNYRLTGEKYCYACKRKNPR